MAKHVPIFNLVALAAIICITYAALGGYRSVIWTDIVQTFFLVGIVLFVVISLVSNYGSGFISNAPLLRESISIDGLIGLSVSFILLGIVFKITTQDIWIRTGACEEFIEAKAGIILSVIIVPLMILSICILGAFALNIPLNVSDGSSLFTSLATSSEFSNAVMFPALILVLIFAVGISTADTMLITCSQVIYEDLINVFAPNNQKFSSLTGQRLIIIAIGVIGLSIPFVMEDVVDAVFLFIGTQVILFPLLIGAIYKKGKNDIVCILTLVIGLAAGALIVLQSDELIRNMLPIIVFVVSCAIYVGGNFIASLISKVK